MKMRLLRRLRKKTVERYGLKSGFSERDGYLLYDKKHLVNSYWVRDMEAAREKIRKLWHEIACDYLVTHKRHKRKREKGLYVW